MKEKTILELQQSLVSGEYSVRSIVKMYLQRIGEIDKQGPAINAVIEINPDALDIADALDQERKTAGNRSPMHGIPVMLKDNFDTADKMMTTAGSLALAGSVAAQDSFVARKLREAGAVILGKTNLSEWANFRSTRSSSGWSSRGGQTRNPYALDRNPGGSSSGSGVAVAANLCTVAVGTETDGSVISPSNANGIVGIKPTVGLISRSGIIPISHTQDTAGPMARTVTDAAILLGAMAGVDEDDPITNESDDKSFADYTQFLDRDGLRGARIGIARDFLGLNPYVDEIIESAINVMKDAGATVIDSVDSNIEGVEKFGENELEVLSYEFKADLNDYLAGLGSDAPVKSLKEVIEFNDQNRETAMPFFGQERLLAAEAKGPLTDERYQKALATNLRLAREDGIDAMLVDHQLDAVIAPSGSPAWLIDWVNGDCVRGGSSSPAAVAGYPNITVPAGYVFGLPVGISFFSTAYQEPTLLRLAYAFEQATQVRIPPQFHPSVELK